jgi:hypothetical protein
MYNKSIINNNNVLHTEMGDSLRLRLRFIAASWFERRVGKHSEYYDIMIYDYNTIYYV